MQMVRVKDVEEAVPKIAPLLPAFPASLDEAALRNTSGTGVANAHGQTASAAKIYLCYKALLQNLLQIGS